MQSIAHNAQPHLQWPGVFPHQSNESNPDEWEDTKYEVEEFILPGAVHHPSSAHVSESGTMITHARTRRTTTPWTCIYCSETSASLTAINAGIETN